MDKLLTVAPQLLIAFFLAGVTVKLAPISRNAELTYQCSLIRAKPTKETYNLALQKLASITGLVTFDKTTGLASWEGKSFCKETKTLNKR